METPDKSFKNAYDRIPWIERERVRKIIMERNGWSEKVFNHRLNGRSKIQPEEMPAIEKEFQVFGLNAWTGRNTNRVSKPKQNVLT